MTFLRVEEDTIVIKEWTAVDMELDNIKDATLVASAFREERKYQRSNCDLPKLETKITQKNGKFTVWCRDCT